MVYDKDQSPGYYQAMMNAFQQMLVANSPHWHSPLTFELYQMMHALIATANLTNELSHGPPKGTHFPMLPPGQTPSQEVINELFLEGLMGVLGTHSSKDNRDLLSWLYLGYTAMGWNQGHVHATYEATDIPAKFKQLVDTYQSEVLHATSDREKKRAIVKLIRALHVLHFFQDGNGRLNIMLLLNKLLIEQGFHPVILDNPAVFGGGMTLEQLIAEIDKGLAAFEQEVDNTTPEPAWL
jgi:Fic/DOC family